MRVTVCELPDDRSAFEKEWLRLIQHVGKAASQLVMLPDMPFCAWFAASDRPDSAVWAAAVRAHDEWEHKLSDLAPAIVLGSRPVDFGNERYDEGFVWNVEHGVRSVHAQSRAPESASAQSAWYHMAAPEFVPIEVDGVRIGFLMGGELWGESEAALYGEEAVDLLAMPRCSATNAFAEWLERSRKAAAIAHAYALSSNRSGDFGGQGWIIAPDGAVLGMTTSAQPFLTLDVELAAERTTEIEMGPAPASVDPLDTGVPPYS